MMKEKQHAFYRTNLEFRHAIVILLLEKRCVTRRQRDTTISTAHVISGGSRGGPGPPLFSDETEAPTAEKNF